MNRRLIPYILIAITTAMIAATPLLFAQERLSVSVTTANIRNGPGTNFEKIWQAEKYYPVIVIERNGGWVRFKDYEGDEGWIHESLLSPEKTVIVNKPKVNIRSGPGTENPILFQAEKGVPFRVIETKGNWLHVAHADGDTGWILDRLVW